ncbi:hypothetical protein REPUB_Repub11eG0134200 [Reevesia pubescens]
MVVYKIKLVGPNGEVNEFEAPDDKYILDVVEEAGLDLSILARLELATHVLGRWFQVQWFNPTVPSLTTNEWIRVIFRLMFLTQPQTVRFTLTMRVIFTKYFVVIIE